MFPIAFTFFLVKRNISDKEADFEDFAKPVA